MHVADLQHVLTRDPGRPRLTWYGDDGERVELSGAVLHNWVTKIVNLLVEEFDAAPGSRIVLDLPPHWRSVVWALAIWRSGAHLVPAPEHDAAGASGSSPDVVITTRPDAWATLDAQIVAVPLPALARRFDGDLPPGAVDAGSAVMTYGDQLGWVEEIDPDAPALEPGVLHRDLLAWARADAAPAATTQRTLVVGEHLVPTLRRVLAVLSSDGSVVITSPTFADDDARLDRLRDSERITS
jgi:uncharacterized protein (TIGR03089 family)